MWTAELRLLPLGDHDAFPAQSTGVLDCASELLSSAASIDAMSLAAVKRG